MAKGEIYYNYDTHLQNTGGEVLTNDLVCGWGRGDKFSVPEAGK
jgi:hypothetical protein